jgi:transcriptional regulator with XRE-family HTH domain
VNLERLGRQIRAVRVRQRLTQAELAARAGCSRKTIWAMETGRAHRLRIGAIEAVIGAVGAPADIRIFWNGPELDRLLDAGHASMTAAVKRQLERLGWIAKVEVSYSRYGERGRIDLLAWHEPSTSLLVVEIKTELVDVQDLLGTLDAKARLSAGAARGLGWNSGPVVPAIVFAESRTTRDRLARLGTLFDRYAVRGRDAMAWLRHPVGSPSGLLWLTGAAGPVAGRSNAPRARLSGRESRNALLVAR